MTGDTRAEERIVTEPTPTPATPPAGQPASKPPRGVFGPYFDGRAHVYGDALSPGNAHWLLSKTLAYLTHLEVLGKARRISGEVERWTA